MSLRKDINIQQNRDGASLAAEQLMIEVVKKQEELAKKVMIVGQELKKCSTEFKEACLLASQFYTRVHDRNLLSKSVLARIEKSKEISKENELISYVASLQESAKQITKEIKEENEVQTNLLAKLDEVEAILANMKKYISDLPTGSDVYNKWMGVYNDSLKAFIQLCDGFESLRPDKVATDQLCKSAQEKVLKETERLAKVQKEEKAKDSPLSSKSHTPPSESEVLASSGDEVASVASDLSDISLSTPRRDSSSSDEEKEKTKGSPESPKSRLSSSAMVGSLLPQPPVTQPRASSKADLKEPSVVGQRSQVPQVPSVAVSKTSTPQQNKGLLARLGFNKDKSTTQSPQPPITGSSASVTPGVTLQRNGLTTVR